MTRRDVEQHRVLFMALRRLTAAQRVEIAFELTDRHFRMLEARFRKCFASLSDEEFHQVRFKHTLRVCERERAVRARWERNKPLQQEQRPPQ